MKTHILKKIRVILSLLFFIAVTLLFLDIKNFFVEESSSAILYLQFLPSLTKFLYIAGLSTAGFVVVLVLTLLFGRVYCSSICPLGTLQDIISYFAKRKRKNKKKKKFVFTKAKELLRYSILGIVALALILGSSIGVLLLDPFSNYGRVVSSFFRPVVMFANDALVTILEMFDNYSVFPVGFKGIDLLAILFPFVLLIAVAWLSYKRGRLYCNTICPVGTFLGFISKYSFYKIKISEESCSGCGVCERVCKSECIDSPNKFVDNSRCVDCFNCLSVCPSSAVVYEPAKFEFRKPAKQVNEHNESKRDFVKKLGLYFLGLTAVAKAQEKINVYVNNDVPVVRKNPISPPGSISLEHFTDQCTACHLCVTACPTQVLQPSFLEYGFLGMLQPMLVNNKGFCNYECTACMDVCPAGAILPRELADKKLIQIGKAKFVKDNCVVQTQGTDCGACAEHCPTKAVRMVEYSHPKYPNKFLKIPEVTDDICIGCGACEYACPAIPYKAIYVESNEVHQVAKKPLEEEAQPEVSEEEEFPF